MFKPSCSYLFTHISTSIFPFFPPLHSRLKNTHPAWRLGQELLRFMKDHISNNLDIKSNNYIMSENGNQSLLTSYESYQQQYNSKCSEWRSQPVSNRACNDVGCVVVFFIILGAFIVGGAYFINEKGSISSPNQMYISKYAGEITVCLLVALVLSFAYVFLIKLMPKVMVYFLIVFSMAVLFGLGIFGFVIGSIGFALPFLITFVIYGIVLLCLRKKIDMGIILIKVASQFLSQKWGVFLAPIAKVAVNILFSFFWIYSLGCILAVGQDKKNNNQDDTAQQVLTWVWVLFWLVFSFVFYYVMVFTVAVSCAFWYYRVEGKHYLITAYKWLFTSAFGSIVFGAVLVSIVTFARLIVDSKRQSNKNIAVAICLCMISMCLRNLENLLKILNHNAIIVMSVTGENYINSAKTTIGILSRFLGLMSVSDIITGLLVFWGVIIITGLTAVISYYWVSNESSDVIAMIMVISILGSIMISSIVFSVLVEAVSSVFIFYCFDVKFKELGFASHNMPAEINEALGNFDPEYKQ